MSLGPEGELRSRPEHRTRRNLGAVPQSNQDAGHRLRVHAVARHGPLPLALAQERFWFLHQLDPQSPADNVAVALRFEGPLNESAYREAWGVILGRHEILRTRFDAQDGIPYQVIEPPSPAAVEVVDLRHLPPGGRQANAIAQASEESDRPFDLKTGPVYRLCLYRIGDQSWMALVIFHHIVCDLWSLGVLSLELSEAYDALVHGRRPNLRPLPFQYADFAVCHRGWADGPALGSQLEYWRTQLAAVQTHELPSDRPPGLKRGPGVTGVVDICPELLTGIRGLASRTGTTPFMVLVATFAILVSRYTGHPEVLVGTPIANRTRLELKPLVGTFVNTLVLRINSNSGVTFNDLLQHVRQVALEAFAHQDVSFHRLVSDLKPERPTGRGLFFQTLFNVQNVPMRVPRLRGLAIEPVTLARRAAQFDLSVWVDTDVLRQVGFAYDASLFNSTTIDRFIAHYLALLGRFVENPTEELHVVDALLPNERELVLTIWNETARDIPKGTIVGLFEAQAARTPASAAVACHDRTLSYGDLDERSTAVALALASRGVGRGSLVGVCLPRTEDLLVVLLGVLKSGAAYLPLDPTFPVSRLSYILSDSEADLVIVDDHTASLFATRQAVVHRAGLRVTTQADMRSTASAGGEDLAYVIYTSGSTGRPKGVEIEHRSLVNFLTSMQDAVGLSANDRLLAVTTLSFDIAALELFLPLVVGATTAIANRDDAFDPNRLAELIDRHRITVMQATPTTWRMLVDSGWGGSPRLTILSGGESLSRELADRLLCRGRAVWNLYGPTETTIWSTVERIQPGDDVVSVGRPIANTQLFVLDQARRPVPIGAFGELYIGGAGVARGYRGRAELTTQRFVRNPFSGAENGRLYQTGDRARFLSDGRLEVRGRCDDQVKIRGFRVELGEVESCLSSIPGVKQAVAVARADGPDQIKLVAFVVPDGSMPISPGIVRERLVLDLPHYMVPSRIALLPTLPRTMNGKIDRGALPDLPAEHEVQRSDERPATDVERRLAAIWEDELDVRSVGVLEDFFDLGGHSLLAVRVASRIEECFGSPVNVATVLTARTVRQLAYEIEHRRSPRKY